MASVQKALEEYSREFHDYIRSVGECKSKQEEDDIVAKDLKRLKKTLAKPGLTSQMMKECVTRILYAEMLGHSAELGHIHCVNLSSSTGLAAKRTGYLATELCISPSDDLMYLIVANIQKDLKSQKRTDVAAALDAAARLLRPELINAIEGNVTSLRGHSDALVRRKVVGAMHAFYLKTRGEVGEQRHFREALSAKDPSVMDAAVRLLYEVARTDPGAQQDLTEAFLSILSQVAQRRLPRDYDYHNVPAPWLQVRLVRLLALLAAHNEALAQKCQPLLIEVMRRADTGRAIGFAIIAEVVAAAAALPHMPELLELSASAVEGFLGSRNPNTKYMGLKMLSQIASRYPELAARHQCTVMECLEDSDETIRRRTVTLLFAICNEDNIDAIVQRILKYLAGDAMQAAALGADGKPVASSTDEVSGAADAYLKRNITRGLCLVAERFAPSALWYVHAINRILFVAPECVPYTTVQRMLKLIAEGQDGVSEADNAVFRTECVETYFAVAGGGGSGSATIAIGGSSTKGRESRGPTGRTAVAAVPDLLNRVAAWVMGEYGFLTRNISRSMLMDRLCDMLERAEEDRVTGTSGGGGSVNASGSRATVTNSSSSGVEGASSATSDGSDTRSWIVSALMKLAAQGSEGGGVSSYVDELLRRCQQSRSTDLQQRSYEFLELVQHPDLLRKVLPMDGCCEDLQVDKAMSFLNDIVENALASGAKPYDERRMQSVRAATGGCGAGKGGELLPMDAYQQHPRQAHGMDTGAASATMLTTATGAGGAVDFESLQAVNGAGLGPSLVAGGGGSSDGWLRARHGAKRWGMKDLEAAPPAQTAERGGSSSSQQQPSFEGVGSSSNPFSDNGWDGTDSRRHGSTQQQQQHADPSMTTVATAGKLTDAKSHKNEKLRRDIFGSTSGDSKARRARGGGTGGIFGGASSSSSASAATRNTGLDDLFSPSPSSPSSVLAATAGSAASSAEPTLLLAGGLHKNTHSSGGSQLGGGGGGGALGTHRWGATTATTAGAAGSLPGLSVAVQRRPTRNPERASCFIVTVGGLRGSATGPNSGAAVAVAVQLACPAGASLVLPPSPKGVYSVSHTDPQRILLPPAAAAAAPTVGDATASVTFHAQLLIMDVSMLIDALQSGAAAVSAQAWWTSREKASETVEASASSAAKSNVFPVSVADILCPAGEGLSTEFFGREWVIESGETKRVLRASASPSPFASEPQLRRVLTDAAALRVLDVIDAEWIAAASTTPSESNPPVLVLCHLALAADRRSATLTVRCRNAALREVVVNAIVAKC